MSSYILAVVLYFVAGFTLSLAFGFRLKAGEGRHVLLCMLAWPIVLLLVVVWVIEDVLMYLHGKKR